MSVDHHLAEESEDYKRMRAFDREWNGPKFVGMLIATLVVALSVIYGLASIGAGAG